MTGLSIKYKPSNLNINSTDWITGRMASSTSMNTNATVVGSAASLMGNLDYKTYDTMKPFNRFYKVGNWWKG